VCSFLEAQELPPIEAYSATQYGAENQNWAISQSKDNYIYVANNKGLLEFNGAKWLLYRSPNETIIRSVTVIDNRVYTGCYMEFGYWKKDQKGQLVYTSLSEKLQTPLIEDEQFWNIIAIDQWVLFQSLNRIYIYDTKDGATKIIDSDKIIVKMFKTSDGVYFQKLNDGVYRIENGKSVLVTNDTVVKSNYLVNIFNHKGYLLLQTQEKGFFQFKNNALQQWNITSNNLLSKTSVYNSIQLKDGSFILGTISNGMIHLTANGDVNFQVDQSHGLTNNTVLSIFEDAEQNIWLGLDNGINCINMNSALRIYNDDDGKLGTIYASAVYQNNLYLGTNQGLFYKPLKSNEEFQFIEGTKGQVWCLSVINYDLFCGHNLGTFLVKNNTASLISSELGTWNIKPIEGNENLLLQGNYNGLNILEKQNGFWKLKNKIEGFDISSKYFEIYEDNILVSHEYKGVFKLKVANDFSKIISFKKDENLNKGFNSSLLKYNNDILYAYKDGVFKLDKLQNEFKKDSLLSTLFSDKEYTSGKLVVDNNKLWSFSNKEINYISPGKLSEIPKINTIPLPSLLRKEMIGYENIIHLENQEYLFGTSTGYIIINLNKIDEIIYDIHINSITNYALDEAIVTVGNNADGDFKNAENNFEFTFSVAEFDKYRVAEYQYQLVGHYDQWSEWSTNYNALFKNLPYGNYTFNVRARVGNKMSSNVASYGFTIARPWYLSNLAIVLYIASVILFSLFMHNVYKRYYKKQREKLLEKKQREIELKQLENEQQLMYFENEKLQQDIENKNRELAISTMSLIKKNEFLNDIKDELKSTPEQKNLKSVIKIIDKNLNNTDDWKFFEEAFNNADKDFLKKIKSKHPDLTPNDLKLCAYLRLNLSSKEIAPLLNISSKSVEVKRYRLRKKMDLPHEASLTNYILEL
jgi:AraC family transcriptional regulator, chitin signaling transcriptional activator